MGYEPMSAAIRVSKGSLYDYVLVAEDPRATDGFDNAFDTISPGNLNQSLGEPYISVTVQQPTWKPALRELRGDVRAPAKRQQWQISITSSLAKGEPLSVELQSDRTRLPQGTRLILRDSNNESDLREAKCSVPAPGPGAATKLLIIAEQP